jgi:cytochrome c2
MWYSSTLCIAVLCGFVSITAATFRPGSARGNDNVAEGEKIFQRCASCHVISGVDPARKGPTLQGIVGRRIASIEGFSYSPNMLALGTAGTKWDPQTLDKFLQYPSEFVKATKMTAPPVRRESERSDLIAYLTTLH